MAVELTDAESTLDKEMNASGDGTGVDSTTALADGNGNLTIALAHGIGSKDAGYPPECDWEQKGSKHDGPRQDHMYPTWQSSTQIEKARQYNEQHQTGNCGWFFGNAGARSHNRKLQDHLDAVMKRSPALIVGLAECDCDTEKCLRAPGVPGKHLEGSSTRLDHVLARESYEYMTVRGSEDSSVLLGIRKYCGDLKLLEFQKFEADKLKSGKPGYSRGLIVEFNLFANVGFIGRKHTVVVAHLHYSIAKKEEKKVEFFNWLLAAIRKYDVRVIMGDFNMAFFEVVPWFRPKLAQCDIAAWFPWKNEDGVPSSDSCGIWLVNQQNKPCQADLIFPQLCVQEYAVPPGIAQTAPPLWAHAPPIDLAKNGTKTFALAEDQQGWPRFRKNGGPGQPLDCFCPVTKGRNNERCAPMSFIKETLKPSTQVEDGSRCLRLKQVKLEFGGFCHETEGYQKGAHHPLCVVTKNHSQRNSQKQLERHKKMLAAKMEKRKRTASDWPEKRRWWIPKQYGRESSERGANDGRESSEPVATDDQNHNYKGECKENSRTHEAGNHSWTKYRWDQGWQQDDRWDYGWKNKWTESKQSAVPLAPVETTWENWGNKHHGKHAENHNSYSYARQWCDAENHCQQAPFTGTGEQRQPPTTEYVDAQNQASSASPPKFELGQGEMPNHQASSVLQPGHKPGFVAVLDSKMALQDFFNAESGCFQTAVVVTHPASNRTECDFWSWWPEEAPQTEIQKPQQQELDSQQHQIKLLDHLMQSNVI